MIQHSDSLHFCGESKSGEERRLTHGKRAARCTHPSRKRQAAWLVAFLLLVLLLTKLSRTAPSGAVLPALGGPMGNKKRTPKKGRRSEEAENAAGWDRRRLVSTALLAAGVAIFAAAMAALRRHVAGGERFECGPPGMEHLSDAPAQGLHVLTAVDANKCGTCSLPGASL